MWLVKAAPDKEVLSRVLRNVQLLNAAIPNPLIFKLVSGICLFCSRVCRTECWDLIPVSCTGCGCIGWILSNAMEGTTSAAASLQCRKRKFSERAADVSRHISTLQTINSKLRRASQLTHGEIICSIFCDFSYYIPDSYPLRG